MQVMTKQSGKRHFDILRIPSLRMLTIFHCSVIPFKVCPSSTTSSFFRRSFDCTSRTQSVDPFFLPLSQDSRAVRLQPGRSPSHVLTRCAGRAALADSVTCSGNAPPRPPGGAGSAGCAVIPRQPCACASRASHCRGHPARRRPGQHHNMDPQHSSFWPSGSPRHRGAQAGRDGAAAGQHWATPCR